MWRRTSFRSQTTCWGAQATCFCMSDFRDRTQVCGKHHCSKIAGFQCEPSTQNHAADRLVRGEPRSSCVKHRDELSEHAAKYITTARKNLHDVNTGLPGCHRQHSQREQSIALQCLPRLVWEERIRQWCFKDTGGRSTARFEGWL